MPHSLTARDLFRHVKPLRLPERLVREPSSTALFADEPMRDALIRRAKDLAGRLMPLEALGSSSFAGERAVICAHSGGAGARMKLEDDRPDIPVRVLTDDYLLAAAAGLDPWSDLQSVEAKPIADHLYAVACLPRSGSTYFCHLLQGLKTVAQPTEHLRPHILFLAEHRRETGFDIIRWMRLLLRDHDADGRFGTKVIADFAADLWPHLDEDQREALNRDWRGSRFIHLERRDKVAQAVSQFIADETRIWHVRNPGDEAAYGEAKKNVRYDSERIMAAYRRFQDDEARLKTWLQSRDAPLLHVAYEDLVEDVHGVVSEVAAFIRGEAPGPVDLTHEKYFPMSDDVNHAFAERFRGELGKAG